MSSIVRTLLERITAHFTALRLRSDRSFFWRVTLESLIVAVAVALVADALFDVEDDLGLRELSSTQLLVLGGLAAPIYETLLQILPGEIVRIWRPRFWIQVWVVTVPFAVVHFTNDFWSGVCAGLIGGFYLAIIYVHYREKSIVLAISLTAASHALTNTFAILAYLVEKHFEVSTTIAH